VEFTETLHKLLQFTFFPACLKEIMR